MEKLELGLKTYYRGKVAYLVECINENDRRDQDIQGKRWYIDSGGHRWSVTETELRKNRWQKDQ